MKRFILFLIVVLALLFTMGSYKIKDNRVFDKYSYNYMLYEIDTTITDTLGIAFQLVPYPYYSVQIWITSSNDTLVFKRKSSPFDSSSYWAVAEMESIGIVTSGTMKTFGNKLMEIPLTRYEKYYFIPNDTLTVKLFFNFWRSK